MTIEELAENTPEKLEALNDEQLHAVLAPYYTVTRPEMIVREVREAKTPQQQQILMDPKKRAALAALAAEGVDLSFLKRKVKK